MLWHGCWMTASLEKSTSGSSHLEKNSFLEPGNCYLDSTFSFCRRPSIPTGCHPCWTSHCEQCRSYICPEGDIYLSAVSAAHTLSQARLPNPGGSHKKGKQPARPSNQSFTPICSTVGISSILNYHTCHPAPGRMNGIAHIILQSHFLSKYPL